MNFEVELYTDKAKLKIIYGIGFGLFLLSICAIIWAELNWDEYSEVVQGALTGKVKTRGLAPTLQGWGYGFAICIPIVYGLMFWATDFKNPALAVNKDGLFINQQLFSKTFVTWAEMTQEHHESGELWIRFKDPAAIVEKQSAVAKVFLKATYVKEKGPFTLDEGFVTGDFAKLKGLVETYYQASVA